MILGVLTRTLGYLLSLAGYAWVLLLVLEWLVHSLPGAGLNPLRRVLFKAAFPLLGSSQRYASFQWGPFGTRGLLLALGIWVLVREVLPWVIWAGFHLGD